MTIYLYRKSLVSHAASDSKKSFVFDVMTQKRC